MKAATSTPAHTSTSNAPKIRNVKDIARLSVSEAIKADDSELWVFNLTNPRGNINMSIPSGFGTNTVITIPVSSVPIDLTTQATREQLLAAPIFRRIIGSKKAEILNSAQVEEFFKNNDDARRELARINDLIESSDSGSNASDYQYSSEDDVGAISAEESGDISGYAMTLCMSQEFTEDSALTSLAGCIDTLTEKDLEYIVNRSTFAKVKEMAAERLTSGG